MVQFRVDETAAALADVLARARDAYAQVDALLQSLAAAKAALEPEWSATAAEHKALGALLESHK